MEQYLWVAIVVGALISVAAVLLIWRPVRSAVREARFATARRDFHTQREHLEARFFTIAAASGKPRGLTWTNCDFEDDVLYARNRRSGELSAFVAVTISFEAIEGGAMEGVEAVGNLRAATSVFRNVKGVWVTDGRAIFNLNPSEAVRYFQDNLELVGHEFANPT